MLLWRASLRYLTRHPAQCLLAVSGIALGVAIVIGIVLTQTSARASFGASLGRVFGGATHAIVSIDGTDFDEGALARVRQRAPALAPAPNVAGVVQMLLADGRHALHLVGVDPFSSAGRGTAAAVPLAAFVRTPGAVLLAPATARRLGLVSGATFAVIGPHGQQSLHLLALTAADAGDDTLLADDVAVADIATAQEVLGLAGRLTRITLDASDRADSAAQLAALRAALPPGLLLIDSGREARSARALTDAFYTNLDALSLLALLVGGFMIYNTMAFLVMQRRPLFARLRALGVTRAAIARLIAGEAVLLGSCGGVLGVALGYVLARALLAPVDQTLSDHYAAAGRGPLSWSPSLVVVALGLAIATTLLAALLPAWTARNTAPALAARHSVAADSAHRGLAQAALGGSVCAVVAVILLASSARSLYVGFAALGAFILAAMLVVPWLVQRGLSALAARGPWLAHLPTRLALRGAARSMGRVGMAVAALMAATATSIGVGLMVASFRSAVDDWLGQLLRAQIYLSSGVDQTATPAIEPALVAAIRALPAVAAVSRIRRANVLRANDEIRINAYALPPAARRGFQFLAGDPAAVWTRWRHADLALISEPYAYHAQLKLGDALALPTPSGTVTFRVAGIYTDYGSERGVVAISLARFRHYWHDPRVHGLGIYPRPGTDLAALARTLTRLLPAGSDLTVWTNATLRQRSLAVFDRTFVVTDVLTLFAAAIAALGVFNALLALHLERAREYAVMLALGLSARMLRTTLYLQTLLIALLAVLFALPLGIGIALLLIEVINIRSFGWSMALHLSWPALLLPAMGALAAAGLATVYPAERATRIEPAAALRYE